MPCPHHGLGTGGQIPFRPGHRYQRRHSNELGVILTSRTTGNAHRSRTGSQSPLYLREILCGRMCRTGRNQLLTSGMERNPGEWRLLLRPQHGLHPRSLHGPSGLRPRAKGSDGLHHPWSTDRLLHWRERYTHR